MKAYVFNEHGDYNTIKLGEAPKPAPADDQILVKATYGGLNYIDSYFRKGIYPWTFPAIAGVEGSGVVEAVGSKVTNFAPGDRVICIGSGMFAEYFVAPASRSVKLPENIKEEIALAGYLQGMTALTLSEEAHKVLPGQYVLVHAVAGGVGLLLTQICKARGAIVIGTTSTPEKAEIAKAVGADHIIFYKTEDIVKRVMEITNGYGVDVSFDSVGKDTVDITMDSLAKFGSFVSYGNTTGPVPPFTINRLAPKNNHLCRPQLYAYVSTPERLEKYSSELFEMISSGTLKITIFKIYDFEDYRQAAEALETGKTSGKVLLKMESSY
ncbi:hypothetical protein CANCADRAFT_137045 [Tortispora caseinolytica NRRL Y-17796]|uniref:Probable quinone oxidoreductase n=1 Tax=Tortispora caseinolytica NRRL Y-17796 TaxID=767744 RepID=A0A1E4TC10_9ASCO|nr:hypothetical protein CANCADRAFT_137045 [Tortispora caseinolytica NRRL Y-17796]